MPNVQKVGIQNVIVIGGELRQHPHVKTYTVLSKGGGVGKLGVAFVCRGGGAR